MPPRVLLLESRYPEALAGLVRQAGWEPVCVPAVVEAEAAPEEVRAPLERLCRGAVALVVLQTGVGTERLHRLAERLGRADAFLRALRELPVAVRGPKPTAVLHRWGVRPAIAAPSPYTTAELCQALASVDLAGRAVFVQHYGQINAPLRAALQARGALLVDAMPYRWALPEDVGPLQEAVRALVEGAFTALLVTSRPQVLHLFQVAADMGLVEALRQCLNGTVAVAAVGPVARGALAEQGVPVAVEPERPKMAPLVQALRAHLAAVPTE
jgi:uroporphyrinogen-III synthase